MGDQNFIDKSVWMIKAQLLSKLKQLKLITTKLWHTQRSTPRRTDISEEVKSDTCLI